LFQKFLRNGLVIKGFDRILPKRPESLKFDGRLAKIPYKKPGTAMEKEGQGKLIASM